MRSPTSTRPGDFLLGCLVGNLSLELGGSSEPVRTELVRILDRWDTALTECVLSGQRGSGGVRADLDAGELASRLIEAWEGAALRGKVTRSRTPYDRFEAVTLPALPRRCAVEGMARPARLLNRRLVIYSDRKRRLTGQGAPHAAPDEPSGAGDACDEKGR